MIDCPKLQLLKREEDEWRAAGVSDRVEMALQEKTGLGLGQIDQKEMLPVDVLAREAFLTSTLNYMNQRDCSNIHREKQKKAYSYWNAQSMRKDSDI